MPHQQLYGSYHANHLSLLCLRHPHRSQRPNRLPLHLDPPQLRLRYRNRLYGVHHPPPPGGRLCFFLYRHLTTDLSESSGHKWLAKIHP
jgi:hypothetical protein